MQVPKSSRVAPSHGGDGANPPTFPLHTLHPWLAPLSEISCDPGVVKCHNGLMAMQDRANWSKSMVTWQKQKV